MKPASIGAPRPSRRPLLSVTLVVVALLASPLPQATGLTTPLASTCALPPGMGANGNDCFASASALGPMPATAAGTNQAATTEEDEPRPCGLMDRTVWWSFTASGDAALVADTLGSDFDTVLAVYHGTSLSTLSLDGCHDDVAPGGASRVAWNAVAGAQYWLQVGGWNGSMGSIILHVAESSDPGTCSTLGGAPPNDCFADAAPLPVPSRVEGTNLGATVESGEPLGCQGWQGGSTLWWRLTAPGAGRLVIDTSETWIYNFAAVYQGSSIHDLVQLDCLRHWSQSEISLLVEPGVHYWVQFAGYEGDQGNFTLTTRLIPPELDCETTGSAALADGARREAHVTRWTTCAFTFEPDPAADAVVVTLRPALANMVLATSAGSVPSLGPDGPRDCIDRGWDSGEWARTCLLHADRGTVHIATQRVPWYESWYGADGRFTVEARNVRFPELGNGDSVAVHLGPGDLEVYKFRVEAANAVEVAVLTSAAEDNLCGYTYVVVPAACAPNPACPLVECGSRPPDMFARALELPSVSPYSAYPDTAWYSGNSATNVYAWTMTPGAYPGDGWYYVALRNDFNPSSSTIVARWA